MWPSVLTVLEGLDRLRAFSDLEPFEHFPPLPPAPSRINWLAVSLTGSVGVGSLALLAKVLL